MASSKHLVAALLVGFLAFSHSVAKLHVHETDPIKFDSKEEEGNAEGCHFAGTCSTAAECRQPCAALGRNPDAVKCVSSSGENRCCCVQC
ncbi:defensin-like protein 276 [Herrania umbratica]|uniref:Defensin-like protein 276 n=1 Tax=Herrania umbratica TaxID=108875 RepID=A0A6J1BK54_9ROSI|nr:defensin-like protein 276 [Herrania umbratica]